MLDRLKTFWRSYTYKESQLTVGSTFYGPANVYIADDIAFYQGTDNWKSSMYSCKLVVNKIEVKVTHYYCYYIDPEGVELISKHVKYIATDVLLKNINALRLWVA